MGIHKIFADNEIKFIKENYAKFGPAFCADKLHCSYEQIKYIAKKFNLYKDKDLTNQIFFKLTVIKKDSSPRGGKKREYWICKCECGKEKSIIGSSLRSGNTKSCGCWKPLLTHGKSKSFEYHCWQNLKDRCFNKNNSNYHCYGQRGIGVHHQWLESFENFYDYIGPAPFKKHSLGRINNDGNYEPGNVRWETSKQQGRNKSTNKFIEYNGERKCLSEWAEIIGVSRATLWARLSDYGWTIEQALTIPKFVRSGNKTNAVYVEYNGVRKPLTVWAKELSISYKLLYRRIFEKNWSVEKALTTKIQKRRLNIIGH